MSIATPVHTSAALDELVVALREEVARGLAIVWRQGRWTRIHDHVTTDVARLGSSARRTYDAVGRE